MAKDTNGVVPARDASGGGLKRIATFAGVFGTRNFTVKDIRDLKGKRTLVETLPFTTDDASAAQTAGIDLLKVRFDPKRPEQAAAMRQAAPTTFMSFVLPLAAAANETEALRVAFDAMELGADAVVCQWSPRFIAVLAEAGIPVQGHTGLVPRKSTWTGGLRAVGKTLDEALWIHRQLKQFQEAGAWAVELEVVPHQILAELSRRTPLVTTSLGSGSGGDVQFLFAQDILGDGRPPFPRHSKQYADLQTLRDQMQQARVEGLSAFIDDVRSGDFPCPEHRVEAPADLVSAFIDALDRE